MEENYQQHNNLNTGVKWHARLVSRLLPAYLKKEHGGTLAARAVWFLLWAALLALVIFLIEAEKPWDPEIWAQPIADFRREEWVIIGLWWAAVVNVFILLGLILTTRWWLTIGSGHTPAEASRKLSQASLPSPHNAVWVTGVLGACIVATLLAIPRMDLSLWGDEEHSLRQCVLGEHRIDEDTGDLYYRPHKTWENLWEYAGPNNHFLFTFLSRGALERWHDNGWQGGIYFNETLYRLPSLVAGTLTLIAVALLMRTLGFPRAGIIASWFLAIHPWFLRYMSEARGYALMMLFSTLAVLCLFKALRTSRWLWWGLFALCELLFLFSYPGALYLALTLNVAALVSITIERKKVPAMPQLWRWLVSNTMAAIVAIQLLAPTVPQMYLWMQRDRAKADLGLPFLQDVWAFLASGMAWHTWDSSNPLCISWQTLSNDNPLALWFLAIVPALLVLLGLVRFVCRSRVHAVIGIALLLAAPFAFVAIQAKGNILYVWYLIFALPAVAIFFALGVKTLVWVFVRPWPNLHTSGPLAIAAAVLACFWFATDQQRQVVIANPVEPQRDSVLLTRPSLDPYHHTAEQIITVNVVFTTPFYDPRAIKLEPETGTEKLSQLMAEANSEGKALYVNFGSEGLARHVYPDVMEMLDDRDNFELVEKLYGLKLQNTRLVYRYKHAPTKDEIAQAR